MYNELRTRHVLGMAPTFTNDFNCWGATMFIANAKDHLEWVEYDEIGEWLTTAFKPVHKNQVQNGDIVALFTGDREHMHLIHTAVKVGPNQYVHKLGQNVARLETLSRVLNSYSRELKRYIFLRSQPCV